MVETKTRDAGAAVASPESRWRFQLDNHLGSATLELDTTGNVISYEEYHPYGSTGYKALRKAGKSVDEARSAVQDTDRYFDQLGVNPSTPMRTARDRR
jgi:hypothetical protein